jgi:hypothetical protein
MLFHSPQVSQRPAHLGVTAPQDWQTKREVALANATPGAVGVGWLRGLVGDFYRAVSRSWTNWRCEVAGNWLEKPGRDEPAVEFFSLARQMCEIEGRIILPGL